MRGSFLEGVEGWVMEHQNLGAVRCLDIDGEALLRMAAGTGS
jgi:hypothetical protein